MQVILWIFEKKGGTEKYLQNFNEKEAREYLEEFGKASDLEFLKDVTNLNPLLLETAKVKWMKFIYKLETYIICF